MFFLRPILRYALIAAANVAALAGGGGIWTLTGGVWSDTNNWDDAALWEDGTPGALLMESGDTLLTEANDRLTMET